MMNDYSFLKIRRVWQNTADIIPRICTFIGRDTSSCWPILRSVSGVFILQRFRYNGRFVWTISLLFIRIYHQIKPYFTRIYHKMSDVTRSHHLIFVRYHETHQWLEQFLLRACPPPSHVCACPPPSDDCHQLRRSHWPPPVQCNTGHCYIHVCRLYQLQQCTTLVPLLHLWCATAPYVSVLYWLHSCNLYSLNTYMYVRRLCRLHQLQQCNTLVPLVTVTSMMCPCISCTCVTTMFQNPSTSCTTLFWKNEKEEEWWRPGFGQRCQRG